MWLGTDITPLGKKGAGSLMALLCSILIAAAQPQSPHQPFPRSQFDTVDQVTLHYRSWEALTAQPTGNVLLVHGFGGSTYSWRHNVRALQQAGFNVVAVDFPGFGYSGRPPGFNHSHNSRADLLWQFVSQWEQEHQQDGQPWHLVGHSMGASTVVMMEQQRAAKTAALVLVDGALYDTSPLMAGMTEILVDNPLISPLVRYTAQHHILTFEHIKDILTQAYGVVPDSSVVRHYLTPFQRPGTVEAVVDMGASYDRKDLQLNQITSPTLLIWGKEDNWITAEQAQHIKEQIIDARLKILENTVHCPMETQPQAFNRMVISYLSRHNPAVNRFTPETQRY